MNSHLGDKTNQEDKILAFAVAAYMVGSNINSILAPRQTSSTSSPETFYSTHQATTSMEELNSSGQSSSSTSGHSPGCWQHGRDDHEIFGSDLPRVITVPYHAAYAVEITHHDQEQPESTLPESGQRAPIMVLVPVATQGVLNESSKPISGRALLTPAVITPS